MLKICGTTVYNHLLEACATLVIELLSQFFFQSKLFLCLCHD